MKLLLSAVDRQRYLSALLALFGVHAATAADLDRPSINYAKATPNNVITKLQQKLDSGKASLSYDEDHGYLPLLLRELQVPRSSQMFVFSKTSLQRQRISPKTPRAIYFSDDVYVGYCHLGEVLEISAVDPQLGAVGASMLTRLALYDESELNKALGRPKEPRSELTTRRIKSACEPLVQALLFSGETKLTDRVKGSSSFTQEFASLGPHDGRKRSLREFDLQSRLFAYPCSYLIYSESFEALPDTAKEYVYQRLWDVLNGKDTSAEFAHLTAADRQAIREILLATKRNLPDDWTAR